MVRKYTDISADPDDVYYAHTDMLGSVQLMVDDTGAIAESCRYSDWGQTTVVDGTFAKLTTLGSDIGNFIRYTARERALPATFGDDWYFYRARMYRPDAGRFVQRDPLGYLDSPSLYHYVTNRPMNHVDPRGSQSVSSDQAQGNNVVVVKPQGEQHSGGSDWQIPGVCGTHLVFLAMLASCGQWQDFPNVTCDCSPCKLHCAQAHAAAKTADGKSAFPEDIKITITCPNVIPYPDGSPCGMNTHIGNNEVLIQLSLSRLSTAPSPTLAQQGLTSAEAANSSGGCYGFSVGQTFLHEVGHAVATGETEAQVNYYVDWILPLTEGQKAALGSDWNENAGGPIVPPK